MSIKIDLLTGLVIVAIVGVIATSHIFAATPFAVTLKEKQRNMSQTITSSVAYQVAYKQTRPRKR